MPITRRRALVAGLSRTAALLVGAHAVRPAAAAEGSIVVGQIGPFTGLPVPDAPELNLGMKAAFAKVNAAGGVGGRRIALFEVDDTYTGDGFVKAFAEAMKKKPVALLSPVGSAVTNDLTPDHLRGRYNAVSAAVFQVAAIVGPITAGHLLGWRMPVVFVGMLLLGCVAMVVLLQRVEQVIPARANGVREPEAALT